MYYNDNYYQQDGYHKSNGDSYYGNNYANNEADLNASLMSVQSNVEANNNDGYHSRIFLERNGIIQDVKRGDNHSVFKQKRRKNGEIIFTKHNRSNNLTVNENTTFYSCFTYSILHSLGEFGIDAAKQVGINSFKNGGIPLKENYTIYNAMLNMLQIGTTLGFDSIYAYKQRGDRRRDDNFMRIISIEDQFTRNGQVQPSAYREASKFYKQQIDELIGSIKNSRELETFCALYVLAYDFGFSDIKDLNWCYNPKTGKLTNIDYDSGLAVMDPISKNIIEQPSLFIKPDFFKIRQKVFKDYVENSPFLRKILNYVRSRMDEIISQEIWNNHQWADHYANLLSRAHKNTMDKKLNNMTYNAVAQKIDPITQIYNAYYNNTDKSFDAKFPNTARSLSKLYKNKENIYNKLSKQAQQKKNIMLFEKKLYKRNRLELYNNKRMTPENKKALFFNNQIAYELPQINNNIYTPQPKPQNNHYLGEQDVYYNQQVKYENKLPHVYNNQYFQQQNLNRQGLYNNRRMTPNSELPSIYDNQKYYDYKMRKIIGKAI